ncbi:MAG: FtsX-like permease family protein, partial [Rhodothermales bacterium]
MRKVVGAGKRQLVAQFLGESILMSALAVVFALVLVHLMLPYFGELVKRPLELDYTSVLLPILFVLVAVVGLVSGSYPAFFMASLRPIQVLKGGGKIRSGRFGLQRVLIVGQYAASIALVAVSLVIYQQLKYVHETDPGYDREHVVTVRTRDRALAESYSSIRNEWLRQANVEAVTASGHLPTNIGSSTTLQGWEDSAEGAEVRIYQEDVDYDYLEVFGIELAAGRNFSREVSGDTLDKYLINETAARAMGWTPEEAVGRYFLRSDRQNTIIGVMKDFHMHSMHLQIEPLMIGLDTEWVGYISARVSPGDLQATIASLENILRQFSPYPFEYQFLDENFDQLYEAETRLGQTFGFFTILALIIASLGLFGLAAFAAEQRRKEIGIRK